MADKHVEVSETIAAPADTLYDLVSDLSRMGQWSPEATGGRWIGGASGPAVGARFLGNNKSGWRRWSTWCTVTAADRGRRFAFDVAFGPVAIADWSYEFTTTEGGGTRVTETWNDRRPGWMDVASGVFMGVADRAAHNDKNMRATLQALKHAAEKRAAS